VELASVSELAELGRGVGRGNRPAIKTNAAPLSRDSRLLLPPSALPGTCLSSVALKAFSPKIAPLERSCLRHGSKPRKREKEAMRYGRCYIHPLALAGEGDRPRRWMGEQ